LVKEIIVHQGGGVKHLKSGSDANDGLGRSLTLRLGLNHI
jgi:hypothetical protein